MASTRLTCDDCDLVDVRVPTVEGFSVSDDGSPAYVHAMQPGCKYVALLQEVDKLKVHVAGLEDRLIKCAGIVPAFERGGEFGPEVEGA